MKKLTVVLGAFVIISTSAFCTNSSSTGLVKHAVFFRYKKEVSEDSDKLLEIRNRFLELKTKSLKNGKQYIVSIDAGIGNSPEGVDQGMTDGYILTFKNIADRNFYVGCDHEIKCQNGGYKAAGKSYDTAHDKFKEFVGPLLYDANGDGTPIPEGVFVFDFVAE